MSRSYDAVLSGNCLEWKGSVPPNPQPLEVKVIVPDDEDGGWSEERQRKALAALEKIAAHGGLGIPDPVAWQREIRKDRPLPGREE